MTKEQKAFADHISILSKEQQDEYLDIIRKNNQGILAKEFMEDNLPSILSVLYFPKKT